MISFAQCVYNIGLSCVEHLKYSVNEILNAIIRKNESNVHTSTNVFRCV